MVSSCMLQEDSYVPSLISIDVMYFRGMLATFW